jgi:hypothetical protein
MNNASKGRMFEFISNCLSANYKIDIFVAAFVAVTAMPFPSIARPPLPANGFGRKDFLLAEPQGSLSFLFLLGKPRFT